MADTTTITHEQDVEKFFKGRFVFLLDISYFPWSEKGTTSFNYYAVGRGSGPIGKNRAAKH